MRVRQGRLGGLSLFVREVLHDFFVTNKGLLLASAISYNTLLSLLPLLAVLLVIASHVFDPASLVSVITGELELIIPGQSVSFAQNVSNFFDNRDLIGGIGGVVLLFFSSITFRTLEESMAVIFHRVHARRGFWTSALLPFLFILLLAVGLLIITGVSISLDTLANRGFHMLGRHWSIPDDRSGVIYTGGIATMVMLFSALYWILPTARVSFRRALVGGVTATVLWEITRRWLVWYFSNLSMVNIIYGSAGAIIIILLSMEAGAIILLVGAQVIANLEHLDHRRRQ